MDQPWLGNRAHTKAHNKKIYNDSLHKGHKVVGSITPLLISFALVDTFPFRILQANNKIFGIALISQRASKVKMYSVFME